VTRRRWGAVAISGASLLALTVPAAQAAPAPSLSLSAAQVRRARRFWTPARMRNTRGLPAPPVGRAAFPAPADLARRRRPPRRPAGGALDRALSESVADPAAPGTSENGVVFVAGGPNRERGRCSGTSVNAPNFSVVFTAGHCVHDEGHWWARSWVFVPGYRYGERPFGTFPAHWLGTTPGWLRDENFNYDVGVAVVSRNERGQRLAEVAGADGIAWGLPPDQAFDVYGYPVAPPYDGATLQLCPQSRYIGHDLGAFLSPGPLEIGVECEVSGGSSGGGWVVSGNTLDGVTSNSYDSDPTTTFGPYFGKAVEKLFDEAARVR
jgi:V8-like Glu-specific endopeptidase